jgi:hypothetical protein
LGDAPVSNICTKRTAGLKLKDDSLQRLEKLPSGRRPGESFIQVLAFSEAL